MSGLDARWREAGVVEVPRGAESRKPFKACRKCKALVPRNAEQCPICGSKDFTYEWEGLVIVLDVKKSQVARMLGITKPGRYAVKLR